MNGNVDGGKPRSVLYTQILHKALEQPARRRRLLFGLALFVAWRRYTDRVVSSAEEWGPRWLARLVANAFSMLMDFNGARLVRVHPAPPLEPGRRHMVIWHPHAAYTTMALMHTATMTVRGTPLTWFTCVAPVLFTMPGLREALLLLNARSCDPKVVEGLASRGVAVGLQPGHPLFGAIDRRRHRRHALTMEFGEVRVELDNKRCSTLGRVAVYFFYALKCSQFEFHRPRKESLGIFR